MCFFSLSQRRLLRFLKKQVIDKTRQARRERELVREANRRWRLARCLAINMGPRHVVAPQTTRAGRRDVASRRAKAHCRAYGALRTGDLVEVFWDVHRGDEGESQNYLAVVVQRTQGSPYCDLMFADGYSWTHVPHNRIGLRVDGPVALAIHRAHFAASAASRSAAECYGKAFAAAHSCFVDFNLQL